MKVCILTTSFPLRKGDISGMFVLEQARHLIKHGAEISVVSPHHFGSSHREDVNGIQVHRFRYFLPEKLQKLCYGSGMPNNVREFPWTKLQLPLLVLLFTIQAIRHARDCDIIHAHWSIAGLAGFIAARILGKPIVLNIHQGTLRNFTKIEKVLLENVDYVVFNSSYTLSHAMKYAKPLKFAIVPPGVDTEKFQRRSSSWKGTDILPARIKDKPLLFTLGRLVEWKGHRYLIDALRLVKDKMNVHLLIGGEGTLRQDLDNLVRDRGLEDDVTFLGHIPGHLMNTYYSNADIYIQPSIIDKDGTTEGLGVTILEAMACGTPCIGSKVGGIPDIIRDGENGFLVKPAEPEQLAEKISLLLQDKDLRERIGREGRRFVEENYSWNAKAGELMGIYGRLLQKRKNE
ncbi:MAG: glycosyltransferase family 4 protein [Syntrophaceae bacterium]|nr:glycosyltransferase family 4 protein [Syntrophaceae bacterium]